MSSSEKVALYIADCRRQGIEILPPDVNESDVNFTVVGEKRIRFGLAAVKNVGRTAIETIIETREKEGKFTGLQDFCNKVDLRTCNRKVVESLIKSGAFDSLGGLRSQYLNIMDEALNKGHQLQKDRLNGQISMFSYLGDTASHVSVSDDLPPIPEFSPKEKLLLEKEMVGLYISGHPLNQYSLIMENLRGVVSVAELSEVGDRRSVAVAGMVSAVRTIYTKKGRPMSFLKLEDLTGEVEVVVFSDVHEKYQQDLQEDRVVLIRGSTDYKEEEEVKIICKDILFFPVEPSQLFIRIEGEKPLGELVALKDILSSYPGGTPVYLYFEKSGKLLLTGQECWVREDDELYRRIRELLGPDCLKSRALEAG
jgi:DNA polymerase-3 subunit alpha